MLNSIAKLFYYFFGAVFSNDRVVDVSVTAPSGSVSATLTEQAPRVVNAGGGFPIPMRREIKHQVSVIAVAPAGTVFATTSVEEKKVVTPVVAPIVFYRKPPTISKQHLSALLLILEDEEEAA